MGSMWASLRQETVTDSKTPTTVADLEETDPYYFVGLSKDNESLAEGELPMFKLKLPDEYLYRPFKSIIRNRDNMVAVIHF